jgi:hypothetical protein
LPTKQAAHLRVSFPARYKQVRKIEHRMFDHISMNWCGKPWISHEVIVNLIVGMTTKTGLKIGAPLDTSTYPKGIQVTI